MAGVPRELFEPRTVRFRAAPGGRRSSPRQPRHFAARSGRSSSRRWRALWARQRRAPTVCGSARRSSGGDAGRQGLPPLGPPPPAGRRGRDRLARGERSRPRCGPRARGGDPPLDFTTGSHSLFPQARLIGLNVNPFRRDQMACLPLVADARLGWKRWRAPLRVEGGRGWTAVPKGRGGLARRGHGAHLAATLPSYTPSDRRSSVRRRARPRTICSDAGGTLLPSALQAVAASAGGYHLEYADHVGVRRGGNVAARGERRDRVAPSRATFRARAVQPRPPSTRRGAASASSPRPRVATSAGMPFGRVEGIHVESNQPAAEQAMGAGREVREAGPHREHEVRIVDEIVRAASRSRHGASWRGWSRGGSPCRPASPPLERRALPQTVGASLASP